MADYSPSLPCPHVLDVLSRSAKHQENKKQLVKGHIKELSGSLSFSQEVFSRTYPNIPSLETYVSAKQHSRNLFHPTSIPVPLHEPKVSMLSGRHNPRGSGLKHLPCYLQSNPTNEISTDPPKQLKENLTFSHTSKSCEDKAQYKSRARQAKYQDAIVGGAKPLYPSDSVICLDNGVRYKKALQQKFPKSPCHYTVAEKSETEDKADYVRGQRPERWLDFPHKTRSSSHDWVLRSLSESPSRLVKTQDKPQAVKTVENQKFFNIMKEWASQKQIHLQVKDVPSTDVLLRNMKSLSNRFKMSAALAVVLLAEQHITSHNPANLTANGRDAAKEWEEDLVSEELVTSLERLLVEKEVSHVKVPGAIALYAIHRHSNKAESILMKVIEEESEVERWAAVQCLVYAGTHSASLIAILLKYLFNDHNPSKQEQTTQLLVQVSLQTGLVFHMLADRLNASSWRERLVTCRTLSHLHGNMSKDLCSKLLVCVWEDWSPEVQQAAAQSLGLTGHGKMIHDEIANRLANTSEMVRLDAIKKLRSLGMMTSRVLPGYLGCFTDEHLSIQQEALSVAGELQLQHPLVIKAIKLLLQESRVWSIKISALRALGLIGHCDQELVQLLMWMVRFEKTPEVRAEACRTIGHLKLTDKDVVDSLKALVTVDDDGGVVQEARQTLAKLGEEEGVRDDMLESVCKTVRELGTKETITTTILDTASENMTNYVLENRTRKELSARDYLSHKCRSKTYEDDSTGLHSSSKQSPEDLTSSWGPDRRFIDGKLHEIRTKLNQMKK